MMRTEPLTDIYSFPCGRKFKPERGAVPEHAMYPDLRRVLANKPVSYGEPQARATRGRLGSEERIENLAEMVRSDAHSVVRDFHPNRGVLSVGCQREFTPARHRIPRIDDQ